MDVFSIGLVGTILFATSIGVWLSLRRRLRETTEIKLTEPPRSKKYFSLLRMSLASSFDRLRSLPPPKEGLVPCTSSSLVCLLTKATNLKSLKTLERFTIELWNKGRYEEASWLREEIQRIKLLMLQS